MLVGMALVAALLICFATLRVISYYEKRDEWRERVKQQSKELMDLRAELITSHGENQTLLEEKQITDNYNKRLLEQLMIQSNQGCRVNPGNPNVVKTQQTT